ncbi:MAG: helix-turn-helix transcriptional regulator [Actinomycetota bacterium]|nr:helix-turn-helix transcriptional regulator [Actinomycetota bacterium]
MNKEKAIKKYIPMTETMFFILLSLQKEQHGYGIMLDVKKITKNRIILGAGTIYNSLSRLEKDGLIKILSEYDRKKIYIATELGKKILKVEVERIVELYENAKSILEESI